MPAIRWCTTLARWLSRWPDMAANFIGVVRGANTGIVYAVINPDDDVELDNPRHLLLQNEAKEPVTLLRVPRGDYMQCMSSDALALLLSRLAENR